MNKICTSVEQSQKLIELGINVNTADMDYIPFANNTEEYDCVINVWNNEHEEDWIPAWSLSTLLNLLPKGVSLLSYDKRYATINTVFEIEDVKTEWYNDPVDAAFEVICWLKENGKI